MATKSLNQDYTTRDWVFLLLSFILCFSAAAVGGQFMPGEWYEKLVRPGLAPPNWIFGPVWSLLYCLMAIAAWLVWRQRNERGAQLALWVFVGQLALNSCWSWQFFGRHRIDHALINIVLLLGAITLTIVLFWRHSRWAARLMAPYLAWVSFATLLNFEFWRLNG